MAPFIPNEVLLKIADEIEDLPTICALRLTCRFLALGLLRRVEYRNFCIKTSCEDIAERVEMLSNDNFERHLRKLVFDSGLRDPLLLPSPTPSKSPAPDPSSLWLFTDVANLQIEHLVLRADFDQFHDENGRSITLTGVPWWPQNYFSYTVEPLITEMSLPYLTKLEMEWVHAPYHQGWIPFAGGTRNPLPVLFHKKENWSQVKTFIFRGDKRYGYNYYFGEFIGECLRSVTEILLSRIFRLNFEWKPESCPFNMCDRDNKDVAGRLTRLELVDIHIAYGLSEFLVLCESLQYVKIDKVALWSHVETWADVFGTLVFLKELEVDRLYYFDHKLYNVCGGDLNRFHKDWKFDHPICSSRLEDWDAYVELFHGLGLESRCDVPMCPQLVESMFSETGQPPADLDTAVEDKDRWGWASHGL